MIKDIGPNLRGTLMSIPVGGDIGLEMHPDTDQFLRLDAGRGRARIGPSKDQLTFDRKVANGWCVLVPAGTWHNITRRNGRFSLVRRTLTKTGDRGCIHTPDTQHHWLHVTEVASDLSQRSPGLRIKYPDVTFSLYADASAAIYKVLDAMTYDGKMPDLKPGDKRTIFNFCEVMTPGLAILTTDLSMRGWRGSSFFVE